MQTRGAAGRNSVAATPDGQHTIDVDHDGTVRVWPTRMWTLAGDDLRDALVGAISVAATPDGQHIVGGGGDETVRVWSTPLGNMRRELVTVGLAVAALRGLEPPDDDGRDRLPTLVLHCFVKEHAHVLTYWMTQLAGTDDDDDWPTRF